jgi:hypothetical protein
VNERGLLSLVLLTILTRVVNIYRTYDVFVHLLAVFASGFLQTKPHD